MLTTGSIYVDSKYLIDPVDASYRQHDRKSTYL